MNAKTAFAIAYRTARKNRAELVYKSADIYGQVDEDAYEQHLSFLIPDAVVAAGLATLSARAVAGLIYQHPQLNLSERLAAYRADKNWDLDAYDYS